MKIKTKVAMISALVFFVVSLSFSTAYTFEKDLLDFARKTQLTATLTADPTSYQGLCPKIITFKGRITLLLQPTIEMIPVTLQYRLIRDDGIASDLKELVFKKAGTQEISIPWSFPNDYKGNVMLQLRIGCPLGALCPHPIAESNKVFLLIDCVKFKIPYQRVPIGPIDIPLIP